MMKRRTRIALITAAALFALLFALRLASRLTPTPSSPRQVYDQDQKMSQNDSSSFRKGNYASERITVPQGSGKQVVDQKYERIADVRARSRAFDADAARVREIARAARGFIYYVSREGVTGERRSLATGLGRRITLIRRSAGRTPVVIGFGISTPAQVRASATLADGCVVGSAIVRRIAEIGNKPSLVPSIGRFVRKLTHPLFPSRKPQAASRKH